MPRDVVRRCVFRPYRKGAGPTFRLTIWDTHRRDDGRRLLGYRLDVCDAYAGPGCRTTYRETLFEGEDFGCSPSHAVDSDAAVESLMGFLTLRPGDTDRDYFAAYTPEQLAYCREHAEALSACVQDRFCDEDGNPKEKRR